MVIADRQPKVILLSTDWTTSRFLEAGLLIFFVFFSGVYAQSGNESRNLTLAEGEFNNGNYPKAIELIKFGIENAKKTHKYIFVWLG